jgi:hypothetical protein
MATYEILVSSEGDNEAGVQQRLRNALDDDVPASNAIGKPDVYRGVIVTDRSKGTLEARLDDEGFDGAVVTQIA